MRVFIILMLIFLDAVGLAQSIPTPTALLEKSIVYHDPDDQFLTRAFELELLEVRPNGNNRQTRVSCNVPAATFAARSKIGESVVEFRVEGDRPSVKVNGSSSILPAAVENFRAIPERSLRLRNYYLYLYGLPMKLRDPGTRLPAKTLLATFQNQEVYALRVTYDEKVGSDVWYFYFDITSAALVGYRFYHNEKVGDGEYIILAGEVTESNMRLPEIRTWYTNADDRHLGTDTLVAIEFGRQ